MSLTSVERMYVGHEQSDVALLEADGLTYRCFVYLSRVTWQIEAVCFRVQQDGTEVMVFHNVIVRASSAAITDTGGLPLDSPKIIARGTTFLVHWLEADDSIEEPINVFTRDWALWRATMDMEAFDENTWNNRGSLVVWPSFALYDVCPVLEHATDYIVTRVTAADTVTIQRFDGFDIIDSAWSVSPTLEIAPRVLAVYAHDTDNDVVISWENEAGPGQLWSTRVDADDGANLASVHTFPGFAALDGESNSYWLQAGHCRVGQNRVAVVAECVPAAHIESDTVPFRWMHHVIYREINSDSCARVGNEHWCPGLHMVSRPWSYAGGSAVTNPTPNVYVLLAFRSIVTDEEWSQAYFYACNLDYAQWNVVDDGPGLRPRPICTVYTQGVPDARASGWHPTSTEGFFAGVHQGGPTKRVNHISHASGAPAFGPDVKTRTIAVGVFAKLGTTSETSSPPTAPTLITTVQPERAGIRGLTVYMEDPWTIYRDGSDPEQPVDNFLGAYPRAMHQSVPIGKGLFIGGGTPQIYDGREVTECGFVHRPEIINTDLTSGGDVDLGLHSYYCVFSRVDGAGQTHRSGPSNTVQVSVLGDGNDQVTLQIRCMGLSLGDADAYYPQTSGINIEVFRTSAGNTQYYRVWGSAEAFHRPRDTPVNSVAAIAGTITVYDNLSDAELVLQGDGPYQLDTAGLFAEPIPVTIPAMSVVTSHLNRVWGADSLDPAVIWYSDEILPDLGSEFYLAPQFATGQTFRIGEIGEITAMRAMNSRLVVFTASSIWALSASDAGSGLLSVGAELLHEGTGCINPRSVVLYPQGVGFQSSAGYKLLSRNFEIGYFVLARSRDEAFSTAGAAVEDDLREAGNVLSATLLEDEHQIRLVCNGRPVVTQVWTLTINVVEVGGATQGTWTINGLSQPVSFTTTVPASSATSIASSLEGVIDDLVAADAPDTLQFEVASATSPATAVIVTLLPGVEATLSGTAYNGNTISAVLTETIETQPRVLLYDYLLQQWSRGELRQTNATTRLSELVDGCEWKGDGGSLHVALAQGAVLVERQTGADDEFTDDTSTGSVGIPIDVTFSWWHLAGAAGAQRLWEIAVQTERYNQAAVHAELEYDFDGSYSGQVVQPTTYDWPRTGETVTPADLRIPPQHQRCRAHRLRIYETGGVTTAETMSIIGMTVELGVQQGMTRVNTSTHRGEV